MHLGLGIELPVLLQDFDDLVHDAAALFDVSHFTTAEHDGHLDLVLVLKKSNRTLNFEVDIVFSRFGAKTDLLRFSVVRMLARLLFLFLILVLPVVHNAAYGWSFVRSDFNKIETCVASLF